MARYLATFRDGTGAPRSLALIARNRWAAYDALFDAVPDGASDVRLRAA